MDDTPHVFLIKDKIRCIQKKIMDQLAADLNNALNDDNMLTSSISNVAMASSHPFKLRRRRKRITNPDQQQQQQKMDASDSTTPENTHQHGSHRHGPSSIVSDGDEAAIPSKTQSSSLAAASESDSTSHSEHRRRRRRPFKKPLIPSTSLPSTSAAIRLTRCSSVQLPDRNSFGSRRRRRLNRTETHEQDNELDEHHSTASSSSFSAAVAQNNYVGKRKRSRAIHEDFRLRNASLHEYDMNCNDENNVNQFSSSSSLNLSESDQEPYLTSHEADDEQSDWPRDETSVPRLISWWQENKSDDDTDEEDDEKMLTTTDGALQKIVDGALSMMLAGSKKTLEKRIKHFVHREMLTGNRRHAPSKTTTPHSHLRRHVRLARDTRRSHHHSYNHKRVKSDHNPMKSTDASTPIDSMNIGHQLLEKIGWTPGSGLGLNQNGITAPVQINYRHHRQGLGYENIPMDTGERLETDPLSVPSSHSSQV